MQRNIWKQYGRRLLKENKLAEIQFYVLLHIAPLRESLRTSQNTSFLPYHKFSIKSYVVDKY